MSNQFKQVCITEQKIDVLDAFKFVSDPSYGAISSFLGTIREENLGKKVEKISYDVNTAMAEKKFTEFCDEAFEQFGDGSISMEHFHGTLNVTDISVAIFVGMPHRKESLAACHFLIEALKHRAPIWKKEYYIDGESDWVQGCILHGEGNA